MAAKLTVMEQAALMLEKAKTATPAEAEMLTKRAETLMIRHGLTEAMLAAASPKAQAEPIVRRYFHYKSIYSIGLATNAIRIAEAFGTMRGILSGHKDEWYAIIVGHKSDVDRLAVLLESLEPQVDHAARAWWKETGRYQTAGLKESMRYRARLQFHYSFGLGVASRIKENTRQATGETTGSALVLVGRQEKVNEWIDENMSVGRARARKGSPIGSGAGYMAGRNAATGGSITAN